MILTVTTATSTTTILVHPLLLRAQYRQFCTARSPSPNQNVGKMLTDPYNKLNLIAMLKKGN